MEVKDNPQTSQDIQAWDFFDPGTWYETEHVGVFIKFVNCKGTKSISFGEVSKDKFTLIAKGAIGKNDDTSTLFFHHELTSVSRPKKIEIVESILSHPGIPTIERNRMGNTLAAYFGVDKEINKE